MKLHHKLLFSLLGALGVVFALSLAFQHTRLSALVRRVSTANLIKEEANQWHAIENLQQACNVALSDAMSEGEMDKFRRLLAGQKVVEGLQEITVFSVKVPGRGQDDSAGGASRAAPHGQGVVA
jgi:hypothetical protein